MDSYGIQHEKNKDKSLDPPFPLKDWMVRPENEYEMQYYNDSVCVEVSAWVELSKN